MADISKMNRTWLCSVVFLDIVNYSSQSVELQMKWKDRFNGYLSNAIKDVQEDERVILDTGDGAAACFLGAPEVAMFAALELWHSLLLDEREQHPPFRVRIGINLGPVKLVRDINGAANAIGDGINAGQRIMSFAGENQILVSQSFFEVVSRLSDDYKNLFTLKGVEIDKHIREHTVYNLAPPGAQHSQVSVGTPQEAMPLPAAISHQASPAPEKVAQMAPEKPVSKARGSRPIPLLVGGVVLAIAAAAGGWYFFASAARSNPSVTAPAAKPVQTGATSPVAAPSTAPPPAPVVSAPEKAPEPSPTPVATAAEKAPAPPPAPVATPAKKAPARLPAPVSRPATVASRTSGVLHATIGPAQQGDVVFDNLPSGRLQFTFDHDAWQATIRRQPNGTKTLVMHPLKRGSLACDVGWKIIQ